MSLKLEADIKVDSDPCVVAWDDKLYVGMEDGSIRTYDANLSPGISWPAHQVQLFALAVGNGNVYSASNDGGLKVWTAQGEKIAEIPSTEADIGVIHVFGKAVYAGDEVGNVVVLENNVLKAKYNLLEEVKDIGLKPPYLFTVKDLDVIVTEIKPDKSNKQFILRYSMQGRAPLRITDTALLFMARGGNSLQLHDVSFETSFKKLHEVKVSDMIVTSLSVNGNFAWTAGWDGYLKRWKIANDQLEPAGEIELGSCVNGLVATAPDKVYAILTGGKIASIRAV